MRSAGGCAVTILAAEGDQAVRALACTAGMLSPARLSGLTAPLSGRPFTGEQRHPQPGVARSDVESRPSEARCRLPADARLVTHASGVHDITIEMSSVGVGSGRLSGWARSIGEEPHADDRGAPRPDPPPGARDRLAPTVRPSTAASRSAGPGAWWQHWPYPRALGHRRVPVELGLYAVPLALIAYAVFGTSRQLVVGRVSTVSVMSGSLLAALRPANARRRCCSRQGPHSGARSC